MTLYSTVLIDLLEAIPPRAQRAEKGPPLLLYEHPSRSYGASTCANADSEATFAYAADFSTERQMLTLEIGGARVLQVTVGTPQADAARLLLDHLRTLGATTLNITGNSLSTLLRQFAFPTDVLQSKVDGYLLRVLTLVHARRPLRTVRSGGQSGVECAAIRGAVTLGIPALALLPRGYLYRNAKGVDVHATAQSTITRLLPYRVLTLP